MSIELLEQRLQNYLDAETRILKAQEMSAEGDTHKMAELRDVQNHIDKLTNQIARAKRQTTGTLGGFTVQLNRNG